MSEDKNLLNRNSDLNRNAKTHEALMFSGLRKDLFPKDSHVAQTDKQSKLRPPSITIGLPREQIFAFISEPENFCQFMKDIRGVKRVGENGLQFSGLSEKGLSFEFSAEVIANRPNEVFAWRLTDGEQEVGAITVESAPAGRGTIVSLKHAHGTLPGIAKDKLIGFASSLVGKNPNLRAATDLARLKAHLETGEVPTIFGQPNGNDSEKN